MTLDKILIAIFSLAGMAFTYWFFLMKKEGAVVSVTDLPAGRQGSIGIVVDGGYSPSTISVPKGKTTKINFLRKDQSSCLEEVVLSEFKIKKYLPLNQKVTVEVTPKEKGEYRFECGMNMYHGKIIVR